MTLVHSELALLQSSKTTEQSSKLARLVEVEKKMSGTITVVIVMDFYGSSRSTFRERYEIIKKLGEGGYGIVYLAKSRKDGRLVAVKELASRFQEVARREYEITRNIPCTAHVVCYRDFFVSNGKSYLVMDYLDGDGLRDIISHQRRHFSIQQLLIMFKQLLIGLNTLHENNVAHMDIKVENVIVDRRPVIIDLGMTCSLLSAPMCNLRYSRGTRKAWSPELGYAQTLDHPSMSDAEFFATDIWNLGLVFKNMTDLHVRNMKGIGSHWSRREYLSKWSRVNRLPPTRTSCDGLNQLVDSMLRIDYQDRPTTAELLDNIDQIRC